MDVVCAMATLVVVIAVSLWGGRGHLGHIRHSLDDLAARRAATSRLETLGSPAAHLEPGRTPFEGGVQVVYPLGDGRYEVSVTVGQLTLVTRVVREERR